MIISNWSTGKHITIITVGLIQIRLYSYNRTITRLQCRPSVNILPLRMVALISRDKMKNEAEFCSLTSILVPHYLSTSHHIQMKYPPLTDGFASSSGSLLMTYILLPNLFVSVLSYVSFDIIFLNLFLINAKFQHRLAFQAMFFKLEIVKFPTVGSQPSSAQSYTMYYTHYTMVRKDLFKIFPSFTITDKKMYFLGKVGFCELNRTKNVHHLLALSKILF